MDGQREIIIPTGGITRWKNSFIYKGLKEGAHLLCQMQYDEPSQSPINCTRSLDKGAKYFFVLYFFLFFISQSIHMLWVLKRKSRLDGSSEHPKHVLKLTDMTQFVFTSTYELNLTYAEFHRRKFLGHRWFFFHPDRHTLAHTGYMMWDNRWNYSSLYSRFHYMGQLHHYYTTTNEPVCKILVITVNDLKF